MKMADAYRRLAQALSPAYMTDAFQTGFDRFSDRKWTLRNLIAPRVFPRRDGSFVIQYRVDVASSGHLEAVTLIMCGHLLAAGTPPPEYALNDSDCGFYVYEIDLVVPLFPYDPELPQIERLWRPDGAREYTSGLACVNQNESAEDARREVLAYRLGRRCTMRMTFGPAGMRPEETTPSSVIVKLARPKSLQRAAEARTRLYDYDMRDDSEDGLTVPGSLHEDAVAGISIMECAPGDNLHDLIERGDFETACNQAARLLRKLHEIPGQGFNPVSPGTELERLEQQVRLLGSVYPSLADRLQTLIENLCRAAEEVVCPTEARLVHHDFYDKQVLWCERRTTLLDCDTAAAGDPAVDFGNFVAHLELRVLQHPEHASTIDRGRAAFEQTYGQNDASFAVRVAWWRSASLLRLATVYGLRPRWSALCPDLLSKAASGIWPGKVHI